MLRKSRKITEISKVLSWLLSKFSPDEKCNRNGSCLRLSEGLNNLTCSSTENRYNSVNLTCLTFVNIRQRNVDTTGGWTEQILASHFHATNRSDFLALSLSLFPSPDWLGNRKHKNFFKRKLFSILLFHFLCLSVSTSVRGLKFMVSPVARRPRSAVESFTKLDTATVTNAQTLLQRALLLWILTRSSVSISTAKVSASSSVHLGSFSEFQILDRFSYSKPSSTKFLLLFPFSQA